MANFTMIHKVRGVITTRWKIDITDMLNSAGERFKFDPVGFLGGAIAESDLDEEAWRERTWPDVSAGLFQPTVKWHGGHVGGVSKAPDGTVLDTPRNRMLVREWFSAPGRSIGYVAPYYAALLARWDDPLETWCRWNKPNIAGYLNPNRANYVRGLEAAERYRATEEEGPMPEFHFGFKDYADSHPEVGKALSEERYFAPDLSCQLAEGGLLVYAKETNELRFLPKG